MELSLPGLEMWMAAVIPFPQAALMPSTMFISKNRQDWLSLTILHSHMGAIWEILVTASSGSSSETNINTTHLISFLPAALVPLKRNEAGEQEGSSGSRQSPVNHGLSGKAQSGFCLLESPVALSDSLVLSSDMSLLDTLAQHRPERVNNLK